MLVKILSLEFNKFYHFFFLVKWIFTTFIIEEMSNKLKCKYKALSIEANDNLS